MGGFLLGSGLSTALTHLVSPDAVSDWAWRLPFLAGALIGIVGLIIRKDLPETGGAQALEDEEVVQDLPLKQAFQFQLGVMIRVALFVWSPAVCIYLVFLYLPTYLHQYDAVPLPRALMLNTIAMAFVVALIPWFGHLSDRFGRRPLVIGTQVAAVFLAYPLFYLIDGAHVPLMLVILLVFALIVAAQQGLSGAFMAEQFQHGASRFTAFSLSFNVSYAIFGGTTPLLCAWLVGVTGDHRAAGIYLAATAVLSLVAAMSMREGGGKRL